MADCAKRVLIKALDSSVPGLVTDCAAYDNTWYGHDRRLSNHKRLIMGRKNRTNSWLIQEGMFDEQDGPSIL